MKRILSVLLIAMLFLVACGGAETVKDTVVEVESEAVDQVSEEMDKYDQVEEDFKFDPNKVFKVGLDDTFAPMGFRDDNGELVGFDIDMSKDLAERMGIEIEYQPVDWAMKEAELNGGNIDFIWNGYSITPEREAQVNFSTPYLENRQIIVVMADSGVQTKEDLYDKIVTVQAESSVIDAINKDTVFVENLQNPLVEFATNVECFADLEAGRSDAVAVDEVLARYYMKQNGEENYRVLEDNFGEEKFGVGVRKDDAGLLAALNKAMEDQKADGTYDELYKKWFSDN